MRIRLARALSSVPLVSLLSLLGACVGGEAERAQFDGAPVKRTMDAITSERIVPGLSLAVFNAEGVLWSATSGVKSYETAERMSPHTTFEAASLSKTLFAYVALRELARAQKDPHLPLPALPFTAASDDEARFASLTPRQLLAHMSGLPNWRAMPNRQATRIEDFVASEPLRFTSEAGRFQYSGEGYVYLQRQIEALTARSLNELAEANAFVPFEMSDSSFVFSGNVSDDVANGHDASGAPVEKYQPAVAVAASSLHTTATDYARFLSALVRADASTPAAWRLTQPLTTADEAADFQVEWALGIGVLRHGPHTYLFHWGDNDTFKAYFLYSPDEDIGYVYFANGAAGLSIRNRIHRAVMGKDVPMWPTSYTQAP